jgi:hypothetical protein
MKHFLRIAALLALFAFPSVAEAAACFWVGGTGSYSTSNTASWASATGGTTGTCGAVGGIPKQAADTANFDALSGGGTVTVDTTMNGLTISQLNMGAFTGTLDFSANNPSMSFLGFSVTGTGTRTLNMGSGTFTLTSTGAATLWDASTITGLTFNAGTSTIFLNATLVNNRTFQAGGLTYATVSIGAGNGFVTLISGASSTFGNLNITAPNYVTFALATTTTITNPPTWAGTAYNNNIVIGQTNTAGSSTISVPSGTANMSWLAIYGVTFTGGATFNATNSFDLKRNTGITITGPSGGGGGGHIIGG